MATKGSGNPKGKARKPAEKSVKVVKKKPAAARKKTKSSKPKKVAAPLKPGTGAAPGKPKLNNKAVNKPAAGAPAAAPKTAPPPPKKKAGNNNPAAKTAKETKPPAAARNPAAENPAGLEKELTIEEKLLALKRKMNREIFERCVEKHYFANISEWDEIPLDEPEVLGEDEDIE